MQFTKSDVAEVQVFESTNENMSVCLLGFFLTGFSPSFAFYGMSTLRRKVCVPKFSSAVYCSWFIHFLEPSGEGLVFEEARKKSG